MNNDVEKCKNCGWTGKTNTLLKHLRWRIECKASYDMTKLYKKQKNLHRLKRQARDNGRYAINREKYHQRYLENEEQRRAYQREYDQCHKERKQEYSKLKAHYKKYSDGRMEKIFRLQDLKHLRDHMNGWCNKHWAGVDEDHKYKWEEINKSCQCCKEKMFKFKSKIPISNKPYEINALHCLACCKVTCNICGKDIEKDGQDYQYFKHFYIDGISRDLKDKAKMCPFKTFIYIKDKEFYPCNICQSKEIQEERSRYVQIVGVKYRNYYDSEEDEVKSIVSNPGKEILKCPYNTDDVNSTLCLKGAVLNLGKKVVQHWGTGEKWHNVVSSDYGQYNSHHKNKYEYMCQLKEHIELHDSKRIETHVIELELKEPYNNMNDLNIIDLLIRLKIENLQQVYQVRKIVPAKDCLGFDYDRWLAYCNLEEVELPIPKWNKMENNLAVTEKMKQMKDGNKLLYMVVLTYEGMINDPGEYFETLAQYPDWVQKIKLHFTWSPRIIMEETDQNVQKSILRGEFIQSKRYPGYFMNLATSDICDCDGCVTDCRDAIRNGFTASPVHSCPLPIKRSVLETNRSSSKLTGELWENMLKFAWKTIHCGEESDSSMSTENEENETENSSNCTSDESDSNEFDNWQPESDSD